MLQVRKAITAAASCAYLTIDADAPLTATYPGLWFQNACGTRGQQADADQPIIRSALEASFSHSIIADCMLKFATLLSDNTYHLAPTVAGCGQLTELSLQDKRKETLHQCETVWPKQVASVAARS